MPRNFPSSYLSRCDSRGTLCARVVLNMQLGTFAGTRLGFEECDVESKVLTHLEVRFILSVYERALQVEATIIVIITLLQLVSQRMEVTFDHVVTTATFLHCCLVT